MALRFASSSTNVEIITMSIAINQVSVKSYKAISSEHILAYCPRCRRRKARTERVDYGAGGVTLFCECGDVREEKQK